MAVQTAADCSYEICNWEDMKYDVGKCILNGWVIWYVKYIFPMEDGGSPMQCVRYTRYKMMWCVTAQERSQVVFGNVAHDG